MIIQIGGHFTRCKANLKSSRGVGGGAAAPAMMFAEVMIRLGVQLNLCKKGGGSPPP